MAFSVIFPSPLIFAGAQRGQNLKTFQYILIYTDKICVKKNFNWDKDKRG